MQNLRRRFDRSLAKFVFILAVCPLGQLALAENSEAVKATMLADLSEQIISCSVHPCFGDDAEAMLAGRFVTDDVYYFSNLNDVYPQTRKVLQGLVEWDSDVGPVTDIYFKIIDLWCAPELLLLELERALPGCEMEKDDEAGKEWSCEFESPSSEDSVLIDVYFGPGLVLLELD